MLDYYNWPEVTLPRNKCTMYVQSCKKINDTYKYCFIQGSWVIRNGYNRVKTMPVFCQHNHVRTMPTLT